MTTPLPDVRIFCPHKVEKISQFYGYGLIGRTSEVASLAVVKDIAKTVVVESL